MLMTTVSDIADIPDVIQAKVFQLVDDNGDVRAELKTDVNGERSFTLMDQQGQPRLIAGLDGDNSLKEVDTWSGKNRASGRSRRSVHGKAL